MYKRYQGNSGRMEWVGDPPAPTPVPAPLPPPPPTLPGSPGEGGLAAFLERFLPAGRVELEQEDLLLLLILYLLYRESGDKELLLMMGAMVFF